MSQVGECRESDCVKSGRTVKKFALKIVQFEDECRYLDKAAVVFVAASRTLSLMSSMTRKRSCHKLGRTSMAHSNDRPLKRSWRASQQDSLTRHWLLVKLTRRSSKISDRYLSSVLAGSVTRAFQIPCMLCWILGLGSN